LQRIPIFGRVPIVLEMGMRYSINFGKILGVISLLLVWTLGSSLQAFANEGIPVQFRSSGKTAPNDAMNKSVPPSLLMNQETTKSASPSTQLPTPPANQQPECPPELMKKCHFIPAAYTQNDPNNKVDYGNYDLANRPNGGFISQPKTKLPITGIIIHDTEGSRESAIATFKDPTSYTSAHYIIDTDGQIYQMVRTKDVAWHAGNWYTNMHTIGIEHVGHAVNGGTEYTPEMYRSSALLTKYLAKRFAIPLDHASIIGHDNVQGPTQEFVAGMHYDPGPFWNWQLFYSLMGANPSQTRKSDIITITRPFVKDNNSPITDCSSGTCVTLPNQPANFVYLRTAPSATAPLISDSAIHPDGSPGTTNIDDWSATAVYGQQFVLADQKKDWTGIWFGAEQSPGQYIIPRRGVMSIPVYGRAYPEAKAYEDSQVPVQTVTLLDYKIMAGQRYSMIDKIPTDYYYAWAIDASLPDDHTVVVGKKTYLQIQFNHRIAYVDRDDVTLHTNP
jgi:N-acetyl-anhydromuramyl-L-alanine amidase AmpD